MHMSLLNIRSSWWQVNILAAKRTYKFGWKRAWDNAPGVLRVIAHADLTFAWAVQKTHQSRKILFLFKWWIGSWKNRAKAKVSSVDYVHDRLRATLHEFKENVGKRTFTCLQLTNQIKLDTLFRSFSHIGFRFLCIFCKSFEVRITAWIWFKTCIKVFPSLLKSLCFFVSYQIWCFLFFCHRAFQFIYKSLERPDIKKGFPLRDGFKTPTKLPSDQRKVWRAAR